MESFYLSSLLQKFLPSIHNQIYGGVLDAKLQKILQTAEAQRELILNEAQLVLQERMEQNSATLDDQLQQKKIEIENRQAALNDQQFRIDQFSNLLHLQEIALNQTSACIDTNTKEYTKQSVQFTNIKNSVQVELEKRACCDRFEIFEAIKNQEFNTHISDVSRISLERQEYFKTFAHKIAQKTLQSVYYRYQPRFVWPKSSFLVNFTSKNLVEKYFSAESPILNVLLEGTDTTLTVLTSSEENQFSIKITGGLGVDKEILRLTLEESNTKKLLNPDKIRIIRNKHKSLVEHQIQHMGAEAAKILELDKLHPEILELIGSLNFRTSHRQNQYFHSLEVATLAGMLARELGVDETLAKRAGLLHDIGKVLDYKIEGSHAVISGDYAAKFNEREDVVDTVLSHHDDKIVETPHAFILKAADAMSGARPGARVDMEEGYNKRLDGISAVVQSFQEAGITDTAIMHAGREVHVYVDNNTTPYNRIDSLACEIAQKLENEVEYPGQIRVTVIRRMEVTAVA